MFAYCDEFKEYLKKDKSYSDNTISSYILDITRFNEYLKNNNELHIETITSTAIINYLMYLQSNGKSSATASRSLSSLRCFYDFLKRKNKIKENPTDNLKSFKAERRPPASLTDIQIDNLLDTPVCKNVKGYRDKAILELMYATGLRASDVVRLCISDINLNIGYIFCRGKNKERIAPIYSLARESIKNYIEKRKEIKNHEKTDVLFLNMNGTPLSRQGLWKIIKYYQKKSGIPDNVTPHTIRHSFAIHLLENGADIKSVQEMMGHNSIASTQIYEQVIKNKLSNVYEKAHPRAKIKKDNS